MTEERTFKELLSVIEQAEVILCEAFEEIHDRELFFAEYGTWENFLKSMGKTKSWWKQTRASARAVKKARDQFGVTLGNEAAARDVRTILYRAVNEEVLPRVLKKAMKLATAERSELCGRHIKAVVKTCVTTLDSGGYVWVGEQEEMLAFDAACHEQATEIIHRRHQHAVDGANKNGWSKPIQIIRSEIYGLGIPDEIRKASSDSMIEIKWRVIEEAPATPE